MEEQETRVFQVGLIKGASFRGPDGLTWQKDQIRALREGPQLDYYRKNPRFAVQGSPVRRDGPVRAKSRDEVRQIRARQAEEVKKDLSPVEPPAQDPVEEPVSKIKDTAHLRGFTDQMLDLAKVSVSATGKRDDLVKMADDLGARGPDGQTPDKAKNRQELVGWIRVRQSAILEQVGELESALGETAE